MLQMTAEQLARAAYDVKLITDRQLQEVWGMLGSRNVSLDQFSQAMLRREMVTSYQLARLKRGEKGGYFYGDYKVLYLVGSGSFARVYRAVQQQTGEIVALKVLRRRYLEGKDAESRDAREQFAREGEVGVTLRHPNIVPIFDVSAKGSEFYLVMEFVEGRNLREFVKIRKKCAPEEALRLIADVAAGLDYAFERGIAHRDLKLSNVLVSSRGTAKLVDFGLAAPGHDTSDEALSDHPNPRTIDYAGLERATSVRRDDRRSDIYFVGCMLYHLLSGKPPLPETKDRMKRLSKTRFHEIESLRKLMPGLPRQVASLVNKAMQLDPSLRYQTPRELLADLEKSLAALNEPTVDQANDDDTAIDTVMEQDAARQEQTKPQRAVMFVESNPQMQEIFRKLRSSGFRVLISSDPVRAAGRFEDDFPPAHCIVFSSKDLGEKAFEAFERFVDNPATEDTPAILLLGENQSDWSPENDCADRHLVVRMPITLGKFREILDRLVPEESLSTEDA